MPVLSANIIAIALVVALWAGHLLITLGRPLPPVALWLPGPGLPAVAAVEDDAAQSALAKKHLHHKLIVVSLQWLAILAICLLAG